MTIFKYDPTCMQADFWHFVVCAKQYLSFTLFYTVIEMRNIENSF